MNKTLAILLLAIAVAAVLAMAGARLGGSAVAKKGWHWGGSHGTPVAGWAWDERANSSAD